MHVVQPGHDRNVVMSYRFSVTLLVGFSTSVGGRKQSSVPYLFIYLLCFMSTAARSGWKSSNLNLAQQSTLLLLRYFRTCGLCEAAVASADLRMNSSRPVQFILPPCVT